MYFGERGREDSTVTMDTVPNQEQIISDYLTWMPDERLDEFPNNNDLSAMYKNLKKVDLSKRMNL